MYHGTMKWERRRSSLDITCREAQKLIQPYIDRSIADKDLSALIDHIEACPACREELETGFVVAYALRHLDEDHDASFHITSVFEEDLASAKKHLQNKRIMWIILWIFIILSTAAAVYIFSSRFLPDFMVFIKSGVRRLYHYFRSQIG